MNSRAAALEARCIELALVEPFTIARRRWDAVQNVFVKLRMNGYAGYGEVSPDGDPADVVAALEKLDTSQLDDPFDLEAPARLLPPGEARCALDMALYDLAAHSAGLSVSQLLGLPVLGLPPTSVTVPIASTTEMLARVQRLLDHPVLKIKVGFEGDIELVAQTRSVYGGAIRIDANEGWSAAEATRRLAALEPLRIQLCEQPIARGDPAALASVTSATSIPIYADEDARTATDAARLAGVVDGVNVKLRKTGGIREAIKMIAVARSHSMGVMLGCDLTTGLAATAEARLSPLVDFADIDGPLLLAQDPCPGVVYNSGSMSLPPGTGLGVKGPPW